MALSLYRHSPRSSALKRFLFEGDFKVLSNKKRKIAVPNLYDSSTVLMMDGGVLDIGYMHYDSFWSHLRDIDPDKETWCLVERTKTHNRVFFDLDLKTPSARPTLRQWQDAASVIRETVQECFPSFDDPQQTAMYMSTCEPYERKGAVKAGAHLIMPNIVISLEKQRLLRFVVVMRLRARLGSDCSATLGPEAKGIDWEDLVDQEVYMGINKGGLRTIKSRKCERCPKCNNDNNKGKQACLECDGVGYQVVGTHYMPACKGTSMGLGTQWVLDNRVTRNHSIYQWEGDNSKDFEMPEELKSYTSARSMEVFGTTDGRHVDSGSSSRKRSKGAGAGGGQNLLDNTCKSLKLNRNYRVERGILSGKAQEMLEKMVRNLRFDCINKPYIKAHVDAKMITLRPYKKPTTKLGFLVTLSGEGCTWCINKGSSHTSNRVWMHLKSSGFDLRCFSGKMNTRKKMPCKDAKHFVRATIPYLAVYKELVNTSKDDNDDNDTDTDAQEEQQPDFVDDEPSIMQPVARLLHQATIPPLRAEEAVEIEGLDEGPLASQAEVSRDDLSFLFATQDDPTPPAAASASAPTSDGAPSTWS